MMCYEVRTTDCGQLQGDLAGTALGLTRQPGASGDGATRLTTLQQITGGGGAGCIRGIASPQLVMGCNVLQALQEERY